MAKGRDMCGRFNVTDDPYMHALLQGLGVDLGPLPLRVCEDIAPTQRVSMVIDECGEQILCDATWWLLLTQEGRDFKPLSKYASFNTRSDKLNVPRSAGFIPFRQSRCIIPASGFIETEKGKAFSITPVNQAIAFGGLFREWVHDDTGEMVRSCSIITLPPHPSIAPYHSKSMPLILPNDPDVRNMWLDRERVNTDALMSLLTSRLPLDVYVTPIKRASENVPTGRPVLLPKDDLA
ncbi:SOS response-associated peptidase [Enterovibrio sp. ZSDZ35]|uniref:Abasic site processing protein n=1 Tax=Enterovibrio qingdaonensis TaxID=2899818 RepID=A0ABT5QK03_9GAMM|nr:SOS response-associated peptidase family protein [Enterovibrio sp. ZSDZ35]MDD1781189.1 SOS response-associated peptidase [Enterovibrio sp. ZSDZ35]